MQATFSGFLYGMLLISLFAGVFGLFLVEGSYKYNTDISNSTLAKYNNLNQLHSNAENIKASTSTITQPQGALDILGGFFYNAYKVLISIPQSYDIFTSMTEQATQDTNLGAGGELIKNTLITTVLITIFVSIILAILLKAGYL